MTRFRTPDAAANAYQHACHHAGVTEAVDHGVAVEQSKAFDLRKSEDKQGHPGCCGHIGRQCADDVGEFAEGNPTGNRHQKHGKEDAARLLERKSAALDQRYEVHEWYRHAGAA
jgi:hypothetical protein